MKVLKQIKPTKEQLTVMTLVRSGPYVVRGAAGSGKTTTALYRLKGTVTFWLRRKTDGYVAGDIRVLVLTYNRTLRGYIKALAANEVPEGDVALTISTFNQWARRCVPQANLLNSATRKRKLDDLGLSIPLGSRFLEAEVDYILGRFLPADLDDYLSCERTGRGRSPAVQSPMRQRILDEIVRPFLAWKQANGYWDFSDLAVHLATQVEDSPYHVVVVDEAQDFSANQVRAIMNHLAPDHSVTYVLDAAQRIYPQRFTWTEVGVTVGPGNSKLLETNFRNTKQIAQFAAPLLSHIESDDLAIPDPDACSEEGPMPLLVRGKFLDQLDHIVDFIRSLDPADNDSVAILHAKGGGWFSDIIAALDNADLDFVEISGNDEWPTGPANIALSTMHSAKGLEFDHVIIAGLNDATLVHEPQPGDSQRDANIRLLAMAVGRARKTLTVTYKPAEATDIIDCLDPSTYDVKDV